MLRYIPISLLTVALLGGCSSTPPSPYKGVYGSAGQQRGLDVPPDLSMPANTGSLDIPSAGGGSQLLPAVEGVRVGRDGALRWLESDTAPEALWPGLTAFWTSAGLTLQREDPVLGIMETQWAENRANLPQDFIGRMLPRFHSTGLRDRYRLRIERSESGGSEIFISHYGMAEEIVSSDEMGNITAWEGRPSDPELANEMLMRLMIHLGVPAQRAESAVAASSGDEQARVVMSGTSIVASENFRYTWRRVGIALDRNEMEVIDRHRSAGTFYIRDDKERVLRVQLQEMGDSTRVTVQNQQGGVVPEATAKEILEALYRHMR